MSGSQAGTRDAPAVSSAGLSSAAFNLQCLGRGRDWIDPILPPPTPRPQEDQGQGSGRLPVQEQLQGLEIGKHSFQALWEAMAGAVLQTQLCSVAKLSVCPREGMSSSGLSARSGCSGETFKVCQLN